MSFTLGFVGSQVIAAPPSGGDDGEVSAFDFSLATATYNSNFVDLSNLLNGGVMRSFTFNPAGTRVYVTDNGDVAREFAVSTAWEINTLVSTTIGSFNLTNLVTTPGEIRWSDAGTRLFIGDHSSTAGQRRVRSFDVVGSAWRIAAVTSTTTGSYEDTTNMNIISGMDFNLGGTRMWLSDGGDDQLIEYELASAFSLDAVSIVSVVMDTTGPENTLRSIFFSPGGNNFVYTGNTNDTARHFEISADPYNLVPVTASGYDYSFDHTAQVNNPGNCMVGDLGAKMYIGTRNATNTIFEYDL